MASVGDEGVVAKGVVARTNDIILHLATTTFWKIHHNPSKNTKANMVPRPNQGKSPSERFMDLWVVFHHNVYAYVLQVISGHVLLSLAKQNR